MKKFEVLAEQWRVEAYDLRAKYRYYTRLTETNKKIKDNDYMKAYQLNECADELDELIFAIKNPL